MRHILLSCVKTECNTREICILRTHLALHIDIGAGQDRLHTLPCTEDAQSPRHRSCKEFPVLLSAEAIEPDPGDEA